MTENHNSDEPTSELPEQPSVADGPQADLTEPLSLDADTTSPLAQPDVDRPRWSDETRQFHLDPHPTVPMSIVPPPFSPSTPPPTPPAASGTFPSVPSMPPQMPVAAQAPLGGFASSSGPAGGGGPSYDELAARLVANEARLADQQVRSRRTTRLLVTGGLLLAFASVAGTLAATAWTNGDSEDNAVFVPTVPTTEATTTTLAPRTTTTQPPRTTTTTEPERGTNGTGSSGGPGNRRPTGNDTVDDWLNDSGLTDAYDEFERRNQEFQDQAERWLDEYLGGGGR